MATPPPRPRTGRCVHNITQSVLWLPGQQTHPLCNIWGGWPPSHRRGTCWGVSGPFANVKPLAAGGGHEAWEGRGAGMEPRTRRSRLRGRSPNACPDRFPISSQGLGGEDFQCLSQHRCLDPGFSGNSTRAVVPEPFIRLVILLALTSNVS